jgi:Fic family protein
LRAELLSKGPLEHLPQEVWRPFAARNTWGTNTIEGNSLSRREVEDLLLEGKSVARRPFGDVLETAQHQRALLGLFRRVSQPVGLVTILELHEEVFRGVKPDAGMWRRVNVRITGSKLALPRWEKVMPLLGEWVREFSRRDATEAEVFELGAWMHESFEEIHPFNDGNGRVGRLLLNLFFLKRNWPPVTVTPEHRDDYIDALEAGHGRDLRGLVVLLERLMGSSLLELLEMVGHADDELKPLAVLGRRGTYSAKYLALRASQGALPALKIAGDWRTSARALKLYREHAARS